MRACPATSFPLWGAVLPMGTAVDRARDVQVAAAGMEAGCAWRR